MKTVFGPAKHGETPLIWQLDVDQDNKAYRLTLVENLPDGASICTTDEFVHHLKGCVGMIFSQSL